MSIFEDANAYFQTAETVVYDGRGIATRAHLGELSNAITINNWHLYEQSAVEGGFQTAFQAGDTTMWVMTSTCSAYSAVYAIYVMADEHELNALLSAAIDVANNHWLLKVTPFPDRRTFRVSVELSLTMADVAGTLKQCVQACKVGAMHFFAAVEEFAK